MLQVEPDWDTCDTPAALEGLVGSAFKFKGPGFYLTDTDTLLILASSDSQEFYAYCWNCRFEETIFCEVATMTLQSDERKIKSCERRSSFLMPELMPLGVSDVPARRNPAG